MATTKVKKPKPKVLIAGTPEWVGHLNRSSKAKGLDRTEILARGYVLWCRAEGISEPPVRTFPVIKSTIGLE